MDTDTVVQQPKWWSLLAVFRAVAVVLVGSSVFSSTQGSSAQAAMNIAAFSIASAAIGVWIAVDHLPAVRKWRPLLLPWLLGVITVVSAAGANTHAGGALIFLGLAACITVGSDLDPWSRWTIVVLGVAAVEIGALVYGASGQAWLGYPLILLVGVLLGLNRGAYRIQAEQARALLARSEELRDEQSRAATLDERNRIAREIHDVLAHSLGALGVQIQAAKAVLTDQHDVARTVELLEQAQRMAADGLHETRRAVSALRSDTPPLNQVLAELTSAHQQRYQARVELRVSGNTRTLSPDASLALTRTAQEALVNTAKHAPHQPVHIRLDYDEGQTTLTVTNTLVDRSGPRKPAPRLATLDGGYGLSGMRERLLLIHGSLSVGPRDGEWVVTAVVPQ
ncbi:MAG: histidine kinase [Acidimicrobiaceae bacterium]|nr:histidine kinase [Acidimicrobiaceae bacterium]